MTEVCLVARAPGAPFVDPGRRGEVGGALATDIKIVSFGLHNFRSKQALKATKLYGSSRTCSVKGRLLARESTLSYLLVHMQLQTLDSTITLSTITYFCT